MKKRDMQILLQFLLIISMVAIIFIPVSVLASKSESSPGIEMAKQATKGKQLWITTDHSKHEVLKSEFLSGPEVTDACLSCHTEAAIQFQKTIHWTWKDPDSPVENQLGKGGLSVNNF